MSVINTLNFREQKFTKMYASSNVLFTQNLYLPFIPLTIATKKIFDLNPSRALRLGAPGSCHSQCLRDFSVRNVSQNSSRPILVIKRVISPGRRVFMTSLHGYFVTNLPGNHDLHTVAKIVEIKGWTLLMLMYCTRIGVAQNLSSKNLDCCKNTCAWFPTKCFLGVFKMIQN